MSSDESEEFVLSDDSCSSASLSDDVSCDDFEPETVKKKPVASKKKVLASSTKKKVPQAKAAPKKTAKKKIASPSSSRSISPMEVDRDDEDDNDDHYAEAPAKKAPAKKKTVEQIYQKKTQLEHILLRPDTYIGSTETIRQSMWVWDNTNNAMVHREINYVPGFYKIFDEILVNAADNKIRDPNMDTIKVVIDKENNLISVYNNGRGIPVEIHKKEHVYVPELIFGHLLTSSNYDDDERKVTGGRNGYGAKLCNIFSTKFIVETADKASGRKFKQTFSNNMSNKTEPDITNNTRKEEYTRITFKPDLAKFGMTGIDDDIEALLKKRVYDLAGTVKQIKVYLNDERITFKNFRQYIDLYISNNNENMLGVATKPPVIHEILNDRWEIAFTLSDGQFQQVSFVNSICTYKGGTHVNYVADQLASKLVDAIQKKNKAAPVKTFQIKNHMWLFINCLIENPAFDSQTKENMTLKHTSFGSKCPLGDDFVNKVKKSGLIENVLSWAKFKQDQLLKKTDGHKKSRISGITKLDDANNAGTRHAQDCTLILTEGDSAKTLAVTGLGVVGRDNFGVFPLRGKLLNVREASHKQIMENQEINHIKQIMGLQHGKKYFDTVTLRYGHLMIMTDQDHDGSHIKGLIINFLDHFWPDLLRVPGFLCEFITPIVKVSKGAENSRNRQELVFYTLPQYETWKAENNDAKGWSIKYYKGLGTSTKEDAKRYFGSIDYHRKPFEPLNDEDRGLIDMAFNKKKADNRKEWLRQCRPGTFMDHEMETIPIKEFINKELILFSMADNIRSIPSVVDGLKPGLRKIIFSCFKRNLTKGEIKVAQLAGYVAEHSAYHHGEQSLQSSIIGLAQNFVGSNNISLLEPRGQFGSRLQGGKDAASARYVFTRLAPLARKIYHPADDALLRYLNDDGQMIEPEWYIPVIPMILVNGGEGIGTGWSSFVANYNPNEIVENLKLLMNGESPQTMHPWYRGYKGTIEFAGADKYNVSGIIKKLNSTTLEITELPIRVWTQTYKEFLETLLNGTEKTPAFIKEYKEYHTDVSVHFIVTLSEENMAAAEAEGLEKRFRISTTFTTSNMVCFDEEGRIRKYSSVQEILEQFYHMRLIYYQKRKELLADQLTSEWKKLDNKVRFISEIISGSLKINNRKRADIIAELRTRGYKSFQLAASKTIENEDDQDDGDNPSEHGYNYLLSMALWSLTAEKVEQLKRECEQKQTELDELLGTPVKQLWLRDLDDFLNEWKAFEAEMDGNDADARAKAKPGKSGKKMNVKSKKTFKFSKKMLSDDEDENESESTDDFISDEDDYVPKKKTAKPKATVSKKVSPSASKTTSFSSTSTVPKPVLATAKPFSSIVSMNERDEDEDTPLPSLAQMIAMKKAEKRKEFSPATQTTIRLPSPKKTKPPYGTEVDKLSSDLESNLNMLSQSQQPEAKITTKKKVNRAAAAVKSIKPVAATKKKSKVVISDDEDENGDSDSTMSDESIVMPRETARRARQATKKKVEVIELSSENDDEEDENMTESSFEASEEEEDDDDFEESD